ncbi:ABC transporter permease [Acidihalobacter ferrooxydans]|uniref:Antibiotic ABC transporter permease n=1 Tax=Acidihalobacter ferrooxydans TaxID=1765967 RepID=A0A1P8UIR0_9GAMM|nr:ABC transporter permease [Acidihalobacter ferrooxydans]APZ43694.1 antibiotic ABC transporter permease [Acidihalobacter ferrooxydans]
MWRRIFALVVKELLTLLRDPRERIIIVLPPLLQLIIFSYAATFDLNHVPLAVYDQSGGVAAQQLIARFTGSGHFSLIDTLHSQRDVARLIDRQQALMVLSIGPDFARDLHRGHSAQVQLILDGRNSNTALLALGYARSIVSQFNSDWQRTHGLTPSPVQLVTRAWFNPNLESRWFIVPGIVGLLMLVVVMVATSLSVAREREQGTFDQLLVTPLRPAEILLGKAAPGFLIGLFEASAIIVVAIVWFGVPLRGDLLTLYTGIVLFLLSAIGVGLMISALASTLQQALLGAFMFLVPAIILSGFATPIGNMPIALQYLTYLNPLRYFMVVLRGVFLEGTPFALLLDQFWPMALIGVCTLGFAGWLFRHRMY